MAAALAAALVAVSAGAVAAAPAVPDPLPATAGDGCAEVRAEVAPDVDAAAELATRCGTDVEVVSERTEWNTTFVQPDGSLRLDVSAAAVRTRGDDETWVPVDGSLVPSPDGVAVAAGVLGMTFSDGSDGTPLARLERDGHALSLDVPFDLPRPVVDGRQLTYDEVLPGVDLVVTVNPDTTGFSEVLRVESPEAARNPRLRHLEFPVEVSDGLDLVAERGGFAARDAAGETVLSSPTPAMWDSARPAPASTPSFALPGVRRAGPQALVPRAGVERGSEGDREVAPLGGEAVAPLPAAVSDDTVAIVPDAEMLADPATVWPVYIDPSVSATLGAWTAVRDAFGAQFGYGGDEGVGLCDRAVMSSCTGTFRSRLMWQFRGLEAIGALDWTEVRNATFSAVGTHSYDCTPHAITLYRVDGFNAGTVWPGSSAWVPQSTQVVAHKPACANHPARRIEFPAIEAAQAVASANASELALGLRADETHVAYWKRYGYDAQLSVQFNRAPHTPTAARVVNPDAACGLGPNRPAIRDTTPTLVAALSDPDGDSVRPSWELYDQRTGSPLWFSPELAAQRSGVEHSVRLPAGLLAHGRVYHWRVQAIDPMNARGNHVSCEFTVDLERPALPGVAPDPTGPVAYVEDGVAGGVGMAGAFTLTNGGSADVVGYQHAFGSSALGPVTAGATVTVRTTPTTAGPQTLRVASVDAAGNVSDVRLYRFTVDFADGVARWRLDEAAGPTAAAGSSGPPLAVTTSTTRGPGVRAELDEVAGDRALVFDSVQDVAASAGPVISTAGSFSVMAFVRLDPGATSGSATAVSQDGTFTSGFELGVREDGSCPAGLTRCFTFGRQATDSAAGAAVVARSTVPVEPGAWYQLTGLQSAGDGTLSVSVCRLGTPADADVERDPVHGAAAPFLSAWESPGPLRVGQARAGATPVRPWPGSVSDVRLFHGVLAAPQISNPCLAG
ncbi:LamG domain-containing protein [Cellulomonas cellasea]|uniref:LamG-like jellyroll fold domain-containing protein n=1 Tax=Cellulomonas cellasea TaxID=43670 RepID=A0A7W4UG55_9CELL|nr:LamG domain-containing protein [Cellulomonas cellasea]MBB2923534.1 hypothetical protein [Cellulomonas cellasea]